MGVSGLCRSAPRAWVISSGWSTIPSLAKEASSEDTLGMAGGVWRPIEGEFFATRREAHAKIVFDQLEVPIVVPE